DSLGQERYDLDTGEDSWIVLNYDLASGSGQGDMVMFVPVSNFAGAPSGTYVYLFTRFGDHETSDDGFEEWAAVTGPVAAPGPVGGGGGGGGGVGGVVGRGTGGGRSGRAA